MDTVDRATRSRIMSRVGRKNTGAELLLRTALHRSGLRYRLHDKTLPGSPDLVFPRFHAVIFVHGCYWHSHGCYRTTIPKSRRTFWLAKFDANRLRDSRNIERLIDMGWRIMTVWECAIRGKTATPPKNIAKLVGVWLVGKETWGEIPGRRTRLGPTRKR
jgi:DNA mismatch endonuclease (patch repair protein)